MGITFSAKKKSKAPPARKKVAVLGIEAAGKTTLVQTLQYGEPKLVKPTIGFNLGTMKADRLEMVLFDVAGDAKALWNNYATGVDAVLYVVDASRPDTLPIQQPLLEMVNKETRSKKCLFVIALNKTDLKEAITTDEFLRVSKICDIVDSDLIIVRTSSVNGDGIADLREKLASFFGFSGEFKHMDVLASKNNQNG